MNNFYYCKTLCDLYMIIESNIYSITTFQKEIVFHSLTLNDVFYNLFLLENLRILRVSICVYVIMSLSMSEQKSI